MANRRKDTRSYAKANLEIPLNEELPPPTRKNGQKKKGETSHTWRSKDNAHHNP